MSLRDWLRRLFAAPLRVDDAGDEGAEVDADLDEELPAAAEDAESVLRGQQASGLREESKVEIMHDPHTIAFEGAEAEESERDSEPDPSDPKS